MEEENKKISISLSPVLLLITTIIIVIMVVINYKLNDDKTKEIKKATELQAQVNSLNEKIDYLQEKANNTTNIIDNEQISETFQDEIAQEEIANTSKKIPFNEIIRNIYPDNNGNFSRNYYGSIIIDFKYDGDESEIEITIKENNFGEATGKTKLMYENHNLKEKVVDVSIDYSIYDTGGGINTITILTENGNAYTVPWAYGKENNTAQLIKMGENVIRLGDSGGFDLAGNRVFYSDYVYADGE